MQFYSKGWERSCMKKRKFGIFLPTFWSDYGHRSTAQAMWEVAQAAEELGFDSLWACDHIINSERNAGSARCLEPLILMAFLTQQFPRLHFGTDVLVLPQRNAILVAKQAATLSVLSEGRLILGIGAGWSEDEFRYLGADYERRGAHTDEAIAMMKALWRKTPTSFEGEFYNLKDAWFYPNPEGDGPPIWVGGSSPAALRRAARYGDAWMPFWGKWDSFTYDLSKFLGQVQQLRTSENGQTLKIAANVPLRIASESVEFATDTPQPAEKIVEALQPYLEAGLEYVIWNIQSKDLTDYLKQMRLAAEKVVPAIQGV
jgi:probable F420-dependent oxidoreductase